MGGIGSLRTFEDGLLQQGHCNAHERVAADQPILTSLRRRESPQLIQTTS